MHRAFLLAAAIALSGCSDGDIFHEQPQGMFALEQGPPSLQMRCERAGQSRAHDAYANGYDLDVQRATHDAVVADCIKWKGI